jgi:hypothetical protein
MAKFRLLGVLLLLGAVIMACLVWANWHTAAIGGRSLKPLFRPAILFLVLGLGLIFGRKSAALLLVACSAVWAIWFLIATVRHVPIPWAFIDVAVVVAMLIPSAIVVRYWNQLRGW